MTAGRLKAQIVLCAIGIFDLPYIFENFALQFPEKRAEVATVVDGGFLAALSTHGQGPTAKMTKAQNKYHSC